MNREKEVVKTSIISILANIFLSIAKVIVGLISSSIAIITDAINNLSDGMSSLITIIGTKLASKKPDKKHPYGYGRIEYVTASIISALVLYAGITSIVESIKKIITPADVDYSYVTLIVLGLGVIVKIFLGLYVRKKGKQVNSDSLKASGTDALNDAILSFSVLVSALIYMIFKFNIEAYVGAILSLFIIKAGFEMIKDAIGDIIGTRVDGSLSKNIKKEIKSIPNVNGAYDLILNNYGPDRFQGSVHVEVSDNLSATDIDVLSREIQALIYNKFNVLLHTVGIYSINTKDEAVISARTKVHDIVFKHEGILQMHGFYVNFDAKYISFDIVIDFKLKEKEALKISIIQELEEVYPNYNFNITLDNDMSD